ncbi:MAG TPA: hypothetical protein VFV07_13875 [Rhizomicrobium sp.]|nr:hypothetical protein [Rhizomicrobium sp.]
MRISMPRTRRTCEALGVALMLATSAVAGPRFTVIDPLTPAEHATFDARRVETVPTWGQDFSIRSKTYSYRFVGQAPSSGGTTAIPALIVPIRLIVPSSDPGAPPTIFDATPIVPHIVSSPLFSPTLSGNMVQFHDAMLRAEFPTAPEGWHTILVPQLGPTLDVTMPPGSVTITTAKSGKLYGFIVDSKPVNQAISDALHAAPNPQQIVIFVTYNSVESFAFGYHSWVWGSHKKNSALVYMYTSWMEDIDDAIGFPSPDAATLSHEIVETVHDPLLTSRTREWGDHFRDNKCFQSLIEVADAVEDAPLRLVYAKELALMDGKPYLYTLQNAALLPWFERESPSSAADGAYSFPSPRPLRKPAPERCVHKD